jgi:uncharacterized protein YndB with AHSA1/START domain
VTNEETAPTLQLERVLPAPREAVFDAFVDPGQLAEWWGPRGFTSPSIDLDARVGGRYRIAMQPPEGELFHLQGEYLEVDPANRLVYTFEYENPAPDDRVTAVTLSLGDLGENTALALEQGPFATEARRALHEGGWTDGLDRLAAFLARRG